MKYRQLTENERYTIFQLRKTGHRVAEIARILGRHLIDTYRVSIRRTCAVVKQWRPGWYYQPKEKGDEPLRKRIEEIAATRIRYGYRRIYVLLRREGWQVNHKRVHRLYRQAGLHLRSKRPQRRKAAAHRLERPLLTAPNQSWSMDFVADALFDGRKLRALTVVDNFTRESLAIQVGASLKGEDVVDVVERLRRVRGVPARIQVDNGSEFISLAMDRWAYDHGVVLDFSRPGPARQRTTLSSNLSTAASATSASTRAGSYRSTTPARRSKAGDRITITSGRIPRSAKSRLASSRHGSNSTSHRRIFHFRSVLPWG